MRPLFYILAAVAVMGLAFWAYRQNYATHHAVSYVADLKRQIAKLHDQIQMQEADWAYENRPSRLRELALLNFDKLGLLPMATGQLGAISEVPYPVPGGAAADHKTGPGAAPVATSSDADQPQRQASLRPAPRPAAALAARLQSKTVSP